MVNPLSACQFFFAIEESCCPILGHVKRVAQNTDELLAG